ncbi:MAG TPA: GNAT family N-acetyltransferase, partial [Mucilaginibacter sp.]
MHFTIKQLNGCDIALARKLFYFFQVDDGIAEPIVPSDKYLSDLLSKDDFHVIVALQNDQLIGGLTGYELEMYKEEIKEMFLYEIAVVEEYRKKGVAKALIELLKQLCVAKRIKEMYVGTSVNNTAAMKLYKSTGGQADDDIAWFVYTCI